MFGPLRLRQRTLHAPQAPLERAVCRLRRGRDNGRAPRGFEGLAHRHGRGAPGEEVSKGDQLVERSADRLEELSHQAAAKGGVGAKIAQPLAEDAAFLRKLKPSLIKARARGETPTDQEPGTEAVMPTRPPRRRKPSGGG